MKIYVAGKWEERQIIRKIHDSLVSGGHSITCDWTNHTEHSHAKDYAVEDIEGVKQCDLLIAYMYNEYAYKGVWAEIGAALVLDKPVIILGNMANTGIFSHHPLVTKVDSFFNIFEIIRLKEREVRQGDVCDMKVVEE